MKKSKNQDGLVALSQPAKVIPEIPVLPPMEQPSAADGWDLRDRALKPRVGESGGERLVPSYALLFSDGRRVPCAQRCVVGRMPEQPGEAYDTYVVVDDSSQQTSRRHFEFGVTSIGQVWVMDLGSANGTFVRSGDDYMQLPPKQRTVLEENDVIRFGGLSARIERNN
ncbi:FHA domain-containing protein [Bombiscardovia coagulans]|uniref:Phosphopeptide-binding protein n=1 Tax=Bombiscardovia coagulans TaxID=686666 RepID=A0A261EVC0_9BIFI|nr:FHA domain-containing protein [Bombiscardovia coagulans]OZG50596.1 phosphopeptide-binding protein [Bombiscardovia coagulans]